MKKFSKILCAVLMLAIVCTSLAFLVSADSTPDAVAMNPSNVDFGAATLGGVEGNNLPADASWSLYKQKTDPNGDKVYNDGVETENTMLDRYIVTPADGDAYGVFFAGEFQNGGSFQNLQNTYSYNGVELTSDAYYVVDLDIATATELITSLDISLPNRNVVGEWESFGGFPFGTNVNIKTYLPDLGAEWTHFTVVCSMKTNKQYIFVNGEYVGVTGNKAYNDTQLTEGTTLRANGIKLEVAYEASANNTKMIFANESAAVDNVSRRDIVDAEGIAALDAIFAAETPNLKAWAGYPTEVRTGSLPSVVEIDGVEYNSISDANAALRGNFNKTVNILNNFAGRLTVACDATVNLNGFSADIVTVEGGTVTKDGDVVTVDAPYIASQTDTKVSDSTILRAAGLAADTDASRWIFTPTNMNDEDGVWSYVSETAEGEKFVTLLGTPAVNNNSNSYMELQTQNLLIDYNGGAAQYVVVDVDAALLSENTFPFMLIPRNGSGGGMWGGANPHANQMLSSSVGEFRHLTIVYDIANNNMYAFSNGTLTASNEGGAFTSADNFELFKKQTGWKITAFRMASNTNGGLSFKNLQFRQFTGEDAVALQTALSDKNISDWNGNVYSEDYVLPSLGELAIVDGVKYYGESSLSAALTGNDVKQVTIAKSFTDAVTVNCDAVIETNGFNVNIVLGDDVEKTVEGTKIITDAPYQLSASFEKIEHTGTWSENGESYISGTPLENIKAAYLGTVNGGQSVGSFAIQKVNDFNPYIITAAGNADKFVALRQNHNGDTTKDMQFTQMYTEKNLSTGTNYYVIDIDAASDTHIEASMYLAPVLRFADGTSGTPFGRSMHFFEMMTADGSWQHLTIVGDMENNYLYVFNNGTLVGIWGDEEGEDGAYMSRAGGTSTNLKYQAVKVSNSMGYVLDTSASLYLDGLTLRIYDSNEAAGNIEAALASGNLSDWSGMVTGRAGTSLPKVATIDGVGYSSVLTANAALNGEGESEVILDRELWDKITTNKTVTVQKNDLDTIKANAQPEIIGDIVLASNFTVDGNKYIKLNADNYDDYCIEVLWYANADGEGEEAIYYPIGSTVQYIGTTLKEVENYIENGKLHNINWYTLNDDEEPVLVTEWPTVQSLDDVYYYYLDEEVTETDVTITDNIKYNLSLYANFEVNLFVEDANGEYEIGGVKYARLSKGVAVANLSSDLVYEITFTEDGVTYTEKVVVNILNYATAVLNKADVSHQMKRVMMAALDYANEAYALINEGNDNAAIAAILGNAAYAEYIVEDATDFDNTMTGNITSVIGGVQLHLGSDVGVILNLVNGFTGNITVKYSDYKDMEWTHSYDVEEGQTHVIVDDLKVYNLDATFTIIANGEELGTYNLGLYIQGTIEAGYEADFAQALYTYAKVAKAYKDALNNA